MKRLLCKFLADRNGSTATEYAVIAAFIAVAIAASGRIIGTKLSVVFSNISANLN
jgi:pilus assembly protein Flp/PilA